MLSTSLIAAALMIAQPAETNQTPPIRALIVTGKDYPAHKWRETTPVLRSILEKTGRFEVFVSEDVEIMATGMEERYDVALLHYCNWESPMPSQACRDGLARYVAAGKGLVVLHFACGAFDGWDEYVKVIGRIWDKEKTHDPYGPFTVNVIRKDHPITEEMSSFETTDELYFCLTGDPEIDVLMTARSIKTGEDHPMGFVLRYGKGRVFHTPLGHDVQAFSAEGVHKLLQRASEWAATGKVKSNHGG